MKKDFLDSLATASYSQRPMVLVVGDVMLDRYFWGDVARISPEAPVPVVRVERKGQSLGGAANVAYNVSSLGARVALCGVVGSDPAGEEISRQLSHARVRNELLIAPGQMTITKTRIIAQGQQMLRLDEESGQPLDNEILTSVLHRCASLVDEADVVILSDYFKGLFAKDVSHKIIELFTKEDVKVLVDPKGKDWHRYCGATCITPNINELSSVTAMSLADRNTIVEQGRILAKELGISHMLVTMGSHGMVLISKDDLPHFIRAEAREVFDVSGAGDTVIATMAVLVALGASFADAAEVANAAAGIVVGKAGTQPINLNELRARIDAVSFNEKLLHATEAYNKCSQWRDKGEKVVFTNGCFDLLHPGHVRLLQSARLHGSRLVVGLNSDASVRRIKGEGRPVLQVGERAALLAALECVDMVVVFEEDTPLALIERLRPQVLVKGGDYIPEEIVGKETVESWGGKVIVVPLFGGFSTTGIVDRVTASSNKGRRAADKKAS